MRLHYYIAFAGIWTLGNGILHDVFVLLQRRPFDRELIRLLLDGHILIFAGIFYLFCIPGIIANEFIATGVCVITAIFLIGYCALIYKILPSIVTILINLVALVLLVINVQTAKQGKT